MSGRRESPGGARAWTSRPWVSALLVVGVCALVYWPMLGSGGLTATEGHRVIPAWSMMDSGDWLVPRLFGQAYLRKPPGIQWAIALSSEVLGRTELAARAVSALSCTLMALVAWVFAGRWFGWRWALAGGLAQALMPWMWTVGRQAEIEALHTLMVQLACLSAMDVMMRDRPVRALAGALSGALIALGVTGMALTKGPAGAPALVGAFVGACLARRSWRPAAWATVWVGIGVGAAVVGWTLFAVSTRLARTGEAAITQGAGAFLFEPGRIARVIALAPTALAAMVPASLAFLFPWGPDARAEADASDAARERWARARGLALAWAAGLAVCTLAGVGNVRYAMPMAVFAPPAAAAVFAAWRTGGLVRARGAIARAMTLGHPAVITAALLAGAWVWIGTGERALRASSGRDAGVELGRALAGQLEGGGGPAEVWADDLVEARPEVLAYARRAAGGRVAIRWTPGLGDRVTPAPGVWVVAREDEGSGERAAVSRAAGPGWVAWSWEGRVRGYRFWAGRVVAEE